MVHFRTRKTAIRVRGSESQLCSPLAGWTSAITVFLDLLLHLWSTCLTSSQGVRGSQEITMGEHFINYKAQNPQFPKVSYKSSISFTWELVTNTNFPTHRRPTESETLEGFWVRSSHLCFNKSSKWFWFLLKFEDPALYRWIAFHEISSGCSFLWLWIDSASIRNVNALVLHWYLSQDEHNSLLSSVLFLVLTKFNKVMHLDPSHGIPEHL